MFQPLVSIIIPSYNRATIIHETLNSVVNQTYTYWECIIVDDGSIDETVTVVECYCKKDNRFKSYSRPEHKTKGPSSCRNYGVEKANGEYIIFLDSDDLLAPFCLQERVKAFEINKDCDFLVFQMERFLDKPNLHSTKPLKNIVVQHSLSSFLQLNSVWQITSPIYKKELLNKIKGFNENLQNFEDLELAVRALFNSSKYMLFINIDCYYRNDENYSAKYKSNEAMYKSIKAFIIFMKSMDNNIIRQCANEELKIKYKNEVVNAYKKIFILNIKDRIGVYKKQNKEILSFLSKNNYLKLYQKGVFYFVQDFLSRIYKIKGIGAYRCMKYLYR